MKEVWDKVWRKLDEKKKKTTEYEKRFYFFLEQESKQFRGKKVLEAGCGSGRGLIPFAKAKCKCYGIDISKEALKLTKRNVKSAKLSLADARKIPFKDNYFDFVFNSGVIEHFIYPGNLEIIKEMIRVSSAKVLLVVPNRLCFWYRIGKKISEILGKWPYGREYALSPNEILALAKEAGLKDIQIKTFLHLPPPLLPVANFIEKFLPKTFLKFFFAYAIVISGKKS